MGLGDRTSLLNGGLPAWTRAGKTTTTQATTVHPGTLMARRRRTW
jgi:3-mercaptopyruvate sulfurtransferase SseA